jgi:pyrimidine operon attenuation protein/uracil phosphoribosyltransferase
MPVAADYIGLTLPTAAAEKVIVTLDPQNPARDRITVRPAPASESKIAHPKSNIP